MNKRLHILIGLLIIINFLLLLTYGFSQDTGAIYWFKRGVNEKDQDQKIECYQKAIEENPAFVEAYYNLALTFMIQKDYQKAEENFKKALSANPNATNSSLKSNILSRLGSTYRKMERYTEAEEAFQGALNISKDNKFKALTLYELGQTKISEGKYDVAISYFRDGLRISPEDRASFDTGIQLAINQKKINDLFQQASKLVQDQKYVEARSIFNQILDINQNHDETKKQLENITNLLTQRQEQKNQQIQPLYTQALAYMNSGNWSEAIKNLERINRLQPNYSDVNKLLAQAQEQQYQQLLSEQKIENFYMRGIENFDGGNYTVALANFEKVVELNPKYKDIDSRIKVTQNEISRVNDLMNKMPKRDDALVSEAEDNFQIESSNITPTEFSSQQVFTEKSRQLNAAIDSQLVQNYYQEALDLMQRQEWQRAIILLEKVRLIKPNYKNTEFLLSQTRQNLETTNWATTDEKAGGSKSGTQSSLMLAFFAAVIAIPLMLLFISPATRARYYILLRKYDKAREIYERMLSKKPNNIKLYITLANIYVNENRIDEVAIRVFERAIQYNDNLKIQLEPIVTRYYLQQSNSSDTPKHLIQGVLKDELKRMGN